MNTATFEGRNILIVDDDFNELTTFIIYLAKEGANIFGAKNTAEALKISGREQLDLIVSDPEHFSEEINLEGARRNIPIFSVKDYGHIDNLLTDISGLLV